MAKALMYVADAALIAGAVALTVVTGGGGAYALAGAIQLTATQVTALATTMAMMGAGALMSAIGAAMSGGGVSSALSVKAPSANRQTIYGQMRTNGTCIYTSSIGHTINQVIAWASHPCQSVDYLYLDGRELYFTGNGHNAVAGASGWCDEANHYDSGNNVYNFHAGSGNYHVYAQNWLGSYAGGGLSSLTNGSNPPGGDHIVNGDPNWSGTLNGICATYVGASYAATMFSVIPQVKAAIKGKNNIYDPRLDSSWATVQSGANQPPLGACAWTDNAALIIADLLVNKDYGLSYSWSEIDIPALIAAANTCDTPVALASGKLGTWASGYKYVIGQTIVDANGRQQTVTGYYNNGSNQAVSGGSAPTWSTTLAGITYDNQIIWTAGVVGSNLTEKMYTINGIVDWGATPGDTLAQMLEAIGGSQCITTWNGLVKITPAAWYGSTTTFTQADLFGGVKAKERKSRDLCNAVRAKFTCPSYPYAVVGYDKNHKDNSIFDGQFQPVDAPEYAQDSLHGYGSDVNLTADGGVKLYQDRSYHFVQSVGQAQRLMKIYLLRNRQKTTCTIKVNAKALNNVPQDVIQLTFPPMGWSNKYFEISEIRHNITVEGGAPQVTWELDLLETDPSCYTWSTAEERTVLNTASPTLNTATFNVVAPTGLSVSSTLADALVSPDGIITPRLNVTWTQPVDTFVTTGGSILVQYQIVGASGWTQYAITSGTTTQCYISPVVAGATYNVQIAAIHSNGAQSTWVQSSSVTVPLSLSNSVGSGNLLDNSGFESGGVSTWGLYNNAGSNFISLAADTSNFYQGTTSAKVTWTQATTNTCGIMQSGLLRGGWANNTVYVMSFYAYGSGSAIGTTPFLAWNNAPSMEYLQWPTLTSTWQRYVARLTYAGGTVEGSGRCYISVAVPQTGAGTCNFDCVQITQGSITTDYSPSPWEMSAAVVAAQTAANNAQTSATAANNALTTISSDSWLSKGEKPQALQLWNSIAAEKSGIDSSAATAWSDATAYDNAYSSLVTYLNSAYPSGVGTGNNDWNNFNTDSQITGTTWRSTWNAYYTARQSLLNDITVKTKNQAASPTVINPNFELGNNGWTCQNGWSVQGVGSWAYNGGWIAVCAANSGTSAISNQARTPCVPGQVWSAQCVAFCDPGTVVSTYQVRLVYLNSSNAVVGCIDGNYLGTSNNGWTLSKSTATAPAGSAWVYMDVACFNHTTGQVYVDACQLNFVGDNTSTALNGQGSLVAGQSVKFNASTSTSSSITISIPAQSMLRMDGSTFNVNASSVTFSGLSASTSYYFFPYISIATGNLAFTNPTPPLSSSTNNPTYSVQMQMDGRYPATSGFLLVSTGSVSNPTGGGGTTGDNTCPEGQELVTEQTKGNIKAIDVVAGDYLLGKCFATGEDVYRRVVQTRTADAAIWRMVDGHRVSPCEPIWHEGAWKPAFKATGATIDRTNGTRVDISLDSDDYNEQNYYLVDEAPLLIHNVNRTLSC